MRKQTFFLLRFIKFATESRFEPYRKSVRLNEEIHAQNLQMKSGCGFSLATLLSDVRVVGE